MGGTARGYSGPPEQVGRAFLHDHRALFGIENAQQNLEVARSNASRGNSRVLYRQVYQGLPVLYSGYLVAVNEAGAVYYVSGDYYPDLEVLDVSPSVSPASAVSQIRSDLGGAASFKVLQEPVLSIYVDDEGEDLSYHLAYEARAERRDPLEAYKYVIDAQSGEILQKISLVTDVVHGGIRAGDGDDAATANGPTASTASAVNGSGEVYLTNPLHGSPTSVTLNRLTANWWDNFDEGERLHGENIVVTNAEAPEAFSSNHEFDYSPSNTHFDEVMAYYHSDAFEGWLIGSLGMASNQLACQSARRCRFECYRRNKTGHEV